MELTNLVAPECVLPQLRASSKKNLLQELSHRASDLIGVDCRALFSALLERERLGSTAMGRGVAIPHCRLSGVDEIKGVLARLETPVDFDSVDGEPVDLVFLLVAPEAAGSDHLKALASVSRMMRDANALASLRGAEDAGAMYALLGSGSRSEAA
ncbi:MAG: PTS sugar transporter subunit IIA [Pseudomonadota bacterium]